MSNEYSELQAVDFGLGAFIAGAFTELNAEVGPKDYREFLGRPTSRRIFRHDANTPEEFLKAYRGAKAGERTVGGGAKANQVELPLIYYLRKPGLTNGTDKEVTRRRYMYSIGEEGLENPYRFKVLPLVLDYQMHILSWDKPSLDKLQLAWYAYTQMNETFTCRYQLGDDDVFEVPAYLRDHKSLLCSDESVPPGPDAGRVYAVLIAMQIATDIIFGAGVDIPEEYEIQGALSSIINYGDPRNG